ncbi:MAG: ZIP family metal transporter, partial [Betaproteobacteria bacterium]
SRAKALLFNALSGLAAVAGGLVGYFAVGGLKQVFPYLLVVAASSFIYVAVADLLPQMQRRLALRESLHQVLWLAAGLALVLLAGEVLHAH